MIQLLYSDPPETADEKKKREESKGAEPKNDYDITNYVTHVSWSGDSDQAARKLEFSIAYNTPNKDKVFQSLDLRVGGTVKFMQTDVDTSPMNQLFVGRIFYRKRASDSYTFEFACYDSMVYLAKSNIRDVMQGTVKSCIEKVCAYIGLPVWSIPELNTSVDFIADDKSGTEVIKDLLEYERAATITESNPSGNEYTAVSMKGYISVIKKGTMIDYVADADMNVFGAEHSESVEEMVNQIRTVDEAGNPGIIYQNRDDIDHFGAIQKIYKLQPPKKDETVDNAKAAKALLTRQKDESSLSGVGESQCITGYAITVQEEQLRGKFFIKSDSHSFENNVHTMQLTLEYMPDTQEKANITESNEPYYGGGS